MAAADPCDSDILLVSVIHGTFQYGVAVAVSYELSVQDVVIRGEGVVGPSCRGIVAKDIVAVCTFLVKPPQNSQVTPANLVITCTQADGGQTVHTVNDMTTRGFAWEFNRDNPPALFRQTFVHVGDMTTADTTLVTQS